MLPITIRAKALLEFYNFLNVVQAWPSERLWLRLVGYHTSNSESPKALALPSLYDDIFGCIGSQSNTNFKSVKSIYFESWHNYNFTIIMLNNVL